MAKKDNRSKEERDAYHEGRRDGGRGQYQSEGWAEAIGGAIFGKSAKREAYERGNADGRKKRER